MKVIAELLNLPTAAVTDGLKVGLKTSLTPEVTAVKRLDHGKGYLSMIGQLKLAWPAGAPSDLPNSVVVKMPTVEKLNNCAEGIGAEGAGSEPPPSFETYLLPVHNIECRFYTEIGPHLTGPLFVPLPHVYAAKSFECTTALKPGDHGLLVLGDLVGRGRTPEFNSEVLNNHQMEAIIDAVASLQAFCIAHPDWNAAGHYQPSTALIRADLAATVKGSLVAFRTEYPADFTASDADIDRIGDGDVIRKIYSTDPAKIDYYPVAVHGDLWMNNAVFKIDSTGKLSDSLLAILDWQTLQPGPMTDDLSLLIATSVDTDVRRTKTNDWLKLYYRLLGEKLPKGTKIPFSFDDVQQMYRKTFRIGTLIMSILLPYALNDQSSNHKFSPAQRAALARRLQKNIDDTIESYSK